MREVHRTDHLPHFRKFHSVLSPEPFTMYWGSVLLCFCILVQMTLQTTATPTENEDRLRMESKAVAAIPLKSLEKLVEDERASRMYRLGSLLIRPKDIGYDKVKASSEERLSYEPYDSTSERAEEEEEDVPCEHHKKTKKITKKKAEFIKRSSIDDDDDDDDDKDEKRYWDKSPFLVAEESSIQVDKFFESLAERVLSDEPIRRKILSHLKPDSRIEFASSSDVPSYTSRMDFAVDNEQAATDGQGCTMVVKEIRNPDKKKGKNGDKAVKGVIVTKECVHPDGAGQDAKIADVADVYQPPVYEEQSQKRVGNAREVYTPEHRRHPEETYSQYDADDSQQDPQSSSASEKSEGKKYAHDPLESDYIDKMFAEHFKNFPSSFQTTKSSLKQNSEEDTKEVPQQHSQPLTKDSIGFPVYPYHQREQQQQQQQSPHSYSYDRHYSPDHHYRQIADYHHHRNPYNSGNVPLTGYQGHGGYQRYGVQPGRQSHQGQIHHHGNNAAKSAGQGPPPKMSKKSFAYYRKDNPKTDPNNQEYAEEYGQGNYRSFSSDYDSDRDGPK